MVDAHDAQPVALLDAELPVGTVEHHHVARPVAGRERPLGVRVTARDQAGVYFDSLPERDRPRYILPSNASSLDTCRGTMIGEGCCAS